MKMLDLHDGTLTGMLLYGDKVLELRFADVNGRRYVVRLQQLHRLRADNFREGNIIFEANVYDVDFPRELIKKVFGEDSEGEP